MAELDDQRSVNAYNRGYAVLCQHGPLFVQ